MEDLSKGFVNNLLDIKGKMMGVMGGLEVDDWNLREGEEEGREEIVVEGSEEEEGVEGEEGEAAGVGGGEEG